MSETRIASLTDVLEFREGPGILAKDFREEGVPLIRLSGLKDGVGIREGSNYLDPQMVEKRWGQFRLRFGDTLLSTSASLGQVRVVDENGVDAIPYTGIIAFRSLSESVILSNYVRFALTERYFATQVAAMGAGSVMKHFGPMHLRMMTLRVPSLSVQEAVVDFDGALGGKISANRALIDSLDVLRDIIWMRETRKAVEYPLSSRAQFVNGGAYTKGATGAGRVVVRIAELNSGIGASTVYNELDVSDSQVAHAGDLLMSWSGSLTAVRWYRDDAIVNQHIFKVIPRDDFPVWAVACAVGTKLDDFREIADGKATTMGHIKRADLDSLVAWPEISDRLNDAGTVLWDRALAAEKENLRLAATRDELLPLLMSGKITVKDAEKSVEEVV